MTLPIFRLKKKHCSGVPNSDVFFNVFFFFFGYFDPVHIYFDIINTYFWGDLSDISAETATLVTKRKPVRLCCDHEDDHGTDLAVP